jgi:hypothetical protein
LRLSAVGISAAIGFYMYIRQSHAKDLKGISRLLSVHVDVLFHPHVFPVEVIVDHTNDRLLILTFLVFSLVICVAMSMA